MTPLARRFLLRLVHVLILSTSGTGSLTAAAVDDAPVPVFYERYPGESERVGDELELLRENRVRVQHYAPTDVAEFNWERDSFTDYTWWMQMQELRFLLPAIESERPDDQRLARGWFMRWYAEHMVPEPAVARWGEPMTVAYRAMVLVRLLESEARRDVPDPAVMQLLRSTILAHQQDLSRPQRFDALNNHGFIDALGLFETTRAVGDSTASALALSRVESMIAHAVSPAGVEKEHSTAYHFTVLRWLEQMAEYFDSLPGPSREVASRMQPTIARMRRAGFFLCDHAGRMPPIGDTDSLYVTAPGGDPPGATLFDPASGFAIYKGRADQKDCRYVVFRIPDEHIDMRHHCHDDALAVFFSHAGETILGDSGRYSYSSSSTRQFMKSAPAHNTATGYPLGSFDGMALRPAFNARDLAGRKGNGWSAETKIGATKWTRAVRLPNGANTLSIVDRFEPADEGAKNPVEAVVFWHVGSDVIEVIPQETRHDGEQSWILRTRKGQRVRLELKAAGPGRAAFTEVFPMRGSRSPLLAWYSPGQDVLTPVTTIVARVRRDPTLTLTTGLTVEESTCPGPRKDARRR